MENVLCEKKEQLILNNIFEDFKVLLQDSDAAEEKEKVKNSLKKWRIRPLIWFWEMRAWERPAY